MGITYVSKNDNKFMMRGKRYKDDDNNNDDYIYGSRNGAYNGVRKVRKADIIVQEGGAKYYKKPYNKKKNSPFMTNENRNIYKKNMEYNQSTKCAS